MSSRKVFQDGSAGGGTDRTLDPKAHIRLPVNDAATSGIVEGTRVATALGWQKVDGLRIGDAVLTFDNGLKTLRSITRRALWDGDGACPTRFCPLNVPAGAIGNREDMLLLPRQGVLVESDVAEDVLGDPFVLVRAEALDGTCGISRRRPIRAPEVFFLQFDEDQVIFASSGALCICPGGGDILHRAFESPAAGATEYRILCSETSAELIEKITWELEEKWAQTLARRTQAKVERQVPVGGMRRA